MHPQLSGAPLRNLKRSAFIGTFVALAAAIASCATLQGEAADFFPPPAAAPVWAPVAQGIGYAAFGLFTPPREAHALRIDLAAPGLEVVVTPGEGKPGMTVGRRTSVFAAEFGCAAAVNASPFHPVSAVDGEARGILGLSVARGRVVSRPDQRYAALLFTIGGRAIVARQSKLGDLGSVRDAVGGFYVVLENGAVVGRNGRREPRTAAGVSADGRFLYLLVIDGRRSGSVGATDREVGAWLAALGAADALELDGGGSTAMVVRGADGSLGLVNVPIHGGHPGTERVVGNCLGFRAAPLQ